MTGFVFSFIVTIDWFFQLYLGGGGIEDHPPLPPNLYQSLVYLALCGSMSKLLLVVYHLYFMLFFAWLQIQKVPQPRKRCSTEMQEGFHPP